jgi:hypothetical protein
MTNPAPLTQGEDTAKKVDDINKLLEVVDCCQKVVKEGRERHVQIWECFYLKIVPKHPRNPKHVCGRRAGGKKMVS